MYTVIFEVEPKDEFMDNYLELALSLRQGVEKIEGFISVERFASLTTQGKLVSLSFWESEEAIKEWKNNVAHQSAQDKGINSYFKDFRIRAAKIEQDYNLADRQQHK